MSSREAKGRQAGTSMKSRAQQSRHDRNKKRKEGCGTLRRRKGSHVEVGYVGNKGDTCHFRKSFHGYMARPWKREKTGRRHEHGVLQR